MRWWEELDAPLLGRYRVERLLGQGGMAEVLLAHDERFAGKRVAIKAPNLDNFAPNQVGELLQRFQREVQRQGSEPIVGVVAMLDAGEHTDSRGQRHPFLVMDYLSGGSLGDALGGSSGQRVHRQTVNEVLAWLRPVATTLDRLHSRKYLHRDVKPDNILFNADGDPFLADFGIATTLDDIAGSGSMMSVIGSMGPGSPGYQSPESLRGDKFAASDQFSLAVTVYEALTGRLPAPATTRDGWIAALAHWRPTAISELLPELPAQTAATIMRALSGDAQQRFLSCSQFAGAVSDSLVAARAPLAPAAPAAAAPVTAPPPSRPEPVTAPLRPATAPAPAPAPPAAPRKPFWKRPLGIVVILLGLASLLPLSAIVVRMLSSGSDSTTDIEAINAAAELAMEQSTLTESVRQFERVNQSLATAISDAMQLQFDADFHPGPGKVDAALKKTGDYFELAAHCADVSVAAAKAGAQWAEHGHAAGRFLVLDAAANVKRCREFAQGTSFTGKELQAKAKKDERILAAGQRAAQAQAEMDKILGSMPAPSASSPGDDALGLLRDRILAGRSYKVTNQQTFPGPGPDGKEIEDLCQVTLSVRAPVIQPAGDSLSTEMRSECPKLGWTITVIGNMTLEGAVDADSAKAVLRLTKPLCATPLGGECKGIPKEATEIPPETKTDIVLISDELMALTLHDPGEKATDKAPVAYLFRD